MIVTKMKIMMMMMKIDGDDSVNPRYTDEAEGGHISERICEIDSTSTGGDTNLTYSLPREGFLSSLQYAQIISIPADTSNTSTDGKLPHRHTGKHHEERVYGPYALDSIACIDRTRPLPSSNDIHISRHASPIHPSSRAQSVELYISSHSPLFSESLKMSNPPISSPLRIT